MRVFNGIERLPLPVVVFLLAGLFSCQRKADFFFVKNEGAVMPVRVSGQPGSGKFLILLPGGPAGDGQVYRRVFPVFRKSIETSCRMVYYDQRGAGSCQGRYDTTTLNLQQLSEDLDKIVAAIGARYGDPDIYLLGYSYGGALGMTYLLDPGRRVHVKGFIGVAGAYDRKYQADYRQELIGSWLQQWVAEGYLATYEPLRDGFRCDERDDPAECQRDSLLIRQKVESRLRQVEKLNRFKINVASAGRLLGFAFFSAGNPLFSGANEAHHGKYYQPEFNDLLLSDRIGEVPTPVLLVNGRYDTNVPFWIAQRTYEQIGSPPSAKTLLILEQSGHLPMLTEPEELATEILRFVDGN